MLEVTTPGFYMGAGDPNSVLHSFILGTLVIEPSLSEPCFTFPPVCSSCTLVWRCVCAGQRRALDLPPLGLIPVRQDLLLNQCLPVMFRQGAHEIPRIYLSPPPNAGVRGTSSRTQLLSVGVGSLNLVVHACAANTSTKSSPTLIKPYFYETLGYLYWTSLVIKIFFMVTSLNCKLLSTAPILFLSKAFSIVTYWPTQYLFNEM